MALCYLLDTNILSHLIRDPHGRASVRIKAVAADEICTSIIVACELRYGALRRNSPALTRKVDEILACVPVLPFDSEADHHYADIRTLLEQTGRLIGGNDLFIAAHARARDAILVTHNIREFERVPGLKLENWLEFA
ncbi:MAG: type II toxin-antitoxin system VapC family toxin [Pseudomonadota bacterium]